MIARTVQSSRASASAGALECRRAFSADVVIHLRPVHALTVTDDLVFRPLGRAGGGKPPRPGERDADDPAVCEMGRDPLVGDLDAPDPGVAVSRSAHPMPPQSC